MSWLIIGAGVSGYGAAAYLAKGSERVRVSDGRELPQADAARFRALGVELCDGGHREEHLTGIKHVVLSPGVPKTHPLLAAARLRGLEVISEIDLALRDFRGTVIAVTGTNGKSTTCAMLGHGLAQLGLKVGVGGNYGDPPTLMLAQGRTPAYLVLELSSYQLEESRLVAPQVAIFTSFSHDHLARHGSLQAYLAAKWQVFAHLPTAALCLIPSDILRQASRAGLKPPPPWVTVASDVEELKRLAPDWIIEPHNQLNAGFALSAIAHLTHKSPASLAGVLRGFKGLPHRCEHIGSIGGAQVINDSKSTNVESTLVALSSQPAPVILFMGGQGKGESYLPILTAQDKIKKVVTFGASGKAIADDLRDHLAVQEFPTLKEALRQIGGIITGQDSGVLFSPGCASFDEFRNYEERGDFFRCSLQPFLTT